MAEANRKRASDIVIPQLELKQTASERECPRWPPSTLRNRERRAPGARRSSNGLAAIAAVAGRVHIGMDGTLHGILLSPIEPLRKGNCEAKTRRFLPISSARFCCLGADGFVLSVLPGCLFGEFCGMVCSLVVGFCPFSFRRV